jgi:DNA processing protein
VNNKLDETNLFYAVAITFANRIGSVTARRLITHFGSPETIFRESKQSMLKQGLLSSFVASSLFSKDILIQAEKEIEFARKYSIDILFMDDEDYPFRLRHCSDAPVVLYKKGTAGLNPVKSVSIVGTRKASAYGKERTFDIIEGMDGDPVQIVSGLAHGIDTAAHKGALEHGFETIAVLGTGLNLIYPAENKALAKQICGQGALLTEFSSQLTPEKENFPRRNRIIAGMSDAVLVIEAGKRGGALITAELANSYNRDVFALPGRVGDMYSEGCNWLIKTNKAAMVTSTADLYYNMNWDLPSEKKSVKQARLILTEEEEKVFRLLVENGECSLDFICNTTDYSLSKVAGILLNMEMSGVIRSLPGKMYRQS